MGRKTIYTQIKVNHFVFEKKQLKMRRFCVYNDIAYSLQQPFTNVIIAATFAISICTILSRITSYKFVFHTLEYIIT